MSNARQVALLILRDIDRTAAYPDRALDRHLQASSLNSLDKALTTELVYGIMRRQRTLDTLLDRLGKKTAAGQPPDLRRILHIGLYQLRYLSQIPASAAVNTAVELAKINHLGKLSAVVNGMLRQYLRLTAQGDDPLLLPENPVSRLGILHSFPDWLLELWLDRFSVAETEQLCQWFNSTPALDIRINPLKTGLEAVENELKSAKITFNHLNLPLALRLTSGLGNIERLEGFRAGNYTLQDISAQFVTYLLDPQPGETIIDACAAPGGKTTHIAELMGDQGKILACDQTKSRLRQLEANIQRLDLKAIEIHLGDSRDRPEWRGIADRVLIDAPCSGLGTLHKRPDIRWRQTPENLPVLAQRQGELLASAATWVKPKGILVYATCTLNPLENEKVIEKFLADHPDWKMATPDSNLRFSEYYTETGAIEVLPHRHNQDGFFMAKLVKEVGDEK
jgi:16S rRNA (cytosine967-C5)-methyltransferase